MLANGWDEWKKPIEAPLLPTAPAIKPPKASLARRMKPDVLAALQLGNATAKEIFERVGYGTQRRVVLALVELERDGKACLFTRNNRIGVWKVVEAVN